VPEKEYELIWGMSVEAWGMAVGAEQPDTSIFWGYCFLGLEGSSMFCPLCKPNLLKVQERGRIGPPHSLRLPSGERRRLKKEQKKTQVLRQFTDCPAVIHLFASERRYIEP